MEEKKFDQYPRPAVAADMVIFTILNEKGEDFRKLDNKKLKLLLIQRNIEPHLNKYALPGGFVRCKETIDDAAKRELYEETGVICSNLSQLRTISDLHRDERGWVVSCSYLALIDGSKLILNAGTDAKSAMWFDVSYTLDREEIQTSPNEAIINRYYKLLVRYNVTVLEARILEKKTINYNSDSVEITVIESKGFAFDHAKIIAYGIRELLERAERTDILFNLMPEYFTLSELQQVYELLLNKKFTAANFRRKIADKVVETGRMTENSAHRPSRLYKRKLFNAGGI